MTYRVRQLFDDGSQTHIEGLGHEDLCALVETFDNLPSMMLCMIATELTVEATSLDLVREYTALRLLGDQIAQGAGQPPKPPPDFGEPFS
jgi:hypothetical protein